MKIFLPVLMVFVAGCYGFPSHFNYNTFDVFVPCRNADALQTLWPDFNNNRIFHQCISIGHWGTHNCPANLLFSFWDQVCVWDFQWRSPPAPDQITPFPTTQWPRETTVSQQTTTTTLTTTTQTVDTTEEQELTVSPDDTTTTTLELTTEEVTTTTVEDDTTTTSYGELTTLQEITLPEDPDLTPPTPEPTTNLTV